MRNSKAKQLRREVYGEDNSPAARSYSVFAGPVIADPLRRTYQRAKGRGRIDEPHIRLRDRLKAYVRKRLPFMYADKNERRKIRGEARKATKAILKGTLS